VEFPGKCSVLGYSDEVGASTATLDEELHGGPWSIAFEFGCELIERCYGLSADTDDAISDSESGFPSGGLVRDIDYGETEATALDWFSDEAEVASASTINTYGQFFIDGC
jgi:hypothetical protein